MIFYKIIAKKEPSSITKYWSDKKDKDKKEKIPFFKIKQLKVNDSIEKEGCIGYAITMLFQDKQGLLIEDAPTFIGNCDIYINVELLPPSLIYYQKKENKMRLKEDIGIQTPKEASAITLWGTNISQHSPMNEKYEIDYTTLKEMEVGEEITWGTENDEYEVKVIFTDKDGVLVRITQYNNNSSIEKEPYVELKYFQYDKRYICYMNSVKNI